MTQEIKQRIEQINRGEVPQGYKKTQVGIVPVEWEDKKLNNIGEFSKGKGLPGTEMKDSGVPCVGYGDIYTKYNFNFSKAQNFVDQSVADESLPIEKGTLLFTCSGETALEIGKCVCYNGDETIYVGGDIAVLKTKSYVEPLFVGYQQNLFSSIKQKARYGQGHSVVHIYGESLGKLGVAYPKGAKEQQRISDILSKWNKAVSLQENLIEKLELQKKALTQKLLTPKEGWKPLTLKKCGETYGGLSGKNKNDFGKGSPYITYMNIFSNAIVDVNSFDLVSVEEKENQNKVRYGDIFFTTSSETPEEVGMASVLLDEVDTVYLNSFCFGYRLFNFNFILPKFAAYYFRSTYFRSILDTLAQGATRFNLSKSSLINLSIPFPKIDEQKDIANKISTFDLNINHQIQKLEKLKLQRKAMQQLLLTGIVRVN